MSMLQPIVQALGSMFGPLLLALEDEKSFSLFLKSLGWDVELSLADHAIIADLMPLSADLVTLLERVEDFGPGTTATTITTVIDTVDDLMRAIDSLSSLDEDDFSDLIEPLNTTSFWQSLAQDIPQYLLITQIEGATPALHALLLLTGIIEIQVTEDELPRTISRLNWSQLTGLLQNPPQQFANVYDWGGAFQYETLMDRLTSLLLSLGFNAEREGASEAMIERFYPAGGVPLDLRQLNLLLVDGLVADTMVKAGLMVLAVPQTGETETSGLYISNLTWGDLSSVDLSPVSVSGSADASGIMGLRLHPGQAPQFDGAAPEIDFGIAYTPDPQSPILLLGTVDGARLQLDSHAYEIHLQGALNNPEIILRARTTGEGLQAIIAPGDGDAFVRELLGDNDLTVGTDIEIKWSSKTGFSIAGGMELDLTIPLNLTIFFLTIHELHLALGLGTNSKIEGQADIDASAELGPFTLTVANVGLQVVMTPEDDVTASGSFGGMAIDWLFKPPSGVGIEFNFLDTVRGGGFIDYDPATGEYSGIITVEIVTIGVTAIAIITTRPPDNPDGWSLFVSINVDLGSLPIGFGFTLEKVGGVVGVHRAIDQDAFQAGIRTGILDSILFPDDPIANATQILSDIEAAFPIAPDSFVVGAMLQIGWGTPTIVTGSLGLIVQVPDVVIALIGQAECVLPFEDEALIEIHFDIVAILDVAAGTLAIDAGLRDSQIVGFVLTGQMAMRASFLTEPSFLLSMGGFHPAYTPPAGFPSLDRMGFGLSVGDWLSISLEAYLALTSNTVQFGAGLYLYASLIGFKIEGGTEINTLIQFSPFQFTADLSYYITVSAGKIELMGILLTGSISGPNPYFVRGQAVFKLLGLEKEVNIEESIGNKSAVDDVDDVPVLDDVITALQDPESWRAVDEGARIGAVLLAESTNSDNLIIVHPGGSVEVIQRVAPLDVTLEHYGNAGIQGEDTLDVTQVQAGNADLEWDFVEDWFAPAQYFEMSKDTKLSAPSFEKMKGGVRLGDDEADGGDQADTIYNYEQIIHDPEFEVPLLLIKRPFTPDSLTLQYFDLQVSQQSSNLNTISASTLQLCEMQPTRHVIVNRETLETEDGITTQVMTYAEANQRIQSRSSTRTTDQIVVNSSERVNS